MNSNRGELLKEILIGIGLLGAIVLVGAMAPNVFGVLHKRKFTKRNYDTKFKKTVHYLKNRKLIIVKENTDGSTRVELSEKGKRRVVDFNLDELKIKPMKKWDGKWRFAMFDIPDKFKKKANAFREKIKELGLYQYQKSVWIHSYPMENEIDFIAQTFEVRHFVKLGEINLMEGETKVKKRFKLK